MHAGRDRESREGVAPEMGKMRTRGTLGYIAVLLGLTYSLCAVSIATGGPVAARVFTFAG